MYLLYYWVTIDGKDVDFVSKVHSIKGAFRRFKEIILDHPDQRVAFNKLVRLNPHKTEPGIVWHEEIE